MKNQIANIMLTMIEENRQHTSTLLHALKQLKGQDAPVKEKEKLVPTWDYVLLAFSGAVVSISGLGAWLSSEYQTSIMKKATKTDDERAKRWAKATNEVCYGDGKFQQHQMNASDQMIKMWSEYLEKK